MTRQGWNVNGNNLQLQEKLTELILISNWTWNIELIKFYLIAMENKKGELKETMHDRSFKFWKWKLHINNINYILWTINHHLQENKITHWKSQLLICKWRKITKYTQGKASGCWGALLSNQGLCLTQISHQQSTKILINSWNKDFLLN